MDIIIPALGSYGMKIKLETGEIIRLSRDECANQDFIAGIKDARAGIGGHGSPLWESRAYQIGWYAETAADRFHPMKFAIGFFGQPIGLDGVPGYGEQEIRDALRAPKVQKELAHKPAIAAGICRT